MLEDTGFGTVFKSYGEGNAGKGVWGAGGGRGGGRGWGDEITYRDLHVIGALIILFVQHLKVVPEGG